MSNGILTFLKKTCLWQPREAIFIFGDLDLTGGAFLCSWEGVWPVLGQKRGHQKERQNRLGVLVATHGPLSKNKIIPWGVTWGFEVALEGLGAVLSVLKHNCSS